MKVVYNACFGGFSLSYEAMLRYAELKGITVYPEQDHDLWIYWLEPKERRFDSSFSETLSPWSIERSDPALVQVVEELGAEANGFAANLQIRDVPSGSLYIIDEYDGLESVILQEEFEWAVAK